MLDRPPAIWIRSLMATPTDVPGLAASRHVENPHRRRGSERRSHLRRSRMRLSRATLAHVECFLASSVDHRSRLRRRLFESLLSIAMPMDLLTHAHRFTAFVDDIRSGDFEHALILGMGGSSLCPEVLSLTFPTSAELPRLRVLDSTDPQQIEILEEGLDLSKTLFFVSSKSGTTLNRTSSRASFGVGDGPPRVRCSKTNACAY
jgi:glucose-6-phosphate isomerase